MYRYKVGDEITLTDGRVVVVVPYVERILNMRGHQAGGLNTLRCKRCVLYSGLYQYCYRLTGFEENCKSLISYVCYFKWREDVQDENADDRQDSLTEERQPTDMG